MLLRISDSKLDIEYDMIIGEVVRLRVGNYMKKYLPGDCVIEDTRKYIYRRYYVASIEKDKEGKIWSSWVREEEIMSKEETRDERLQRIGIK